jgi:transposase-like protein
VLTCPSCGGNNVRRSRRRSLFALVQRWRGLRRYRCRECRRTFYSQLSPVEREIDKRRQRRVRERRAARSDPKKLQRFRRHATELVLFLCLVVIFYAALKYLARVP